MIKSLILLYDYAQPHIVALTQEKLEEICMAIIIRAAYITDLSHYNYHAFGNQKEALAGHQFEDEAAFHAFVWREPPPFIL